MSLRVAMYWHNGRSLGHTAETGKIAHALATQLPELGLSGLSGAYRGLDLLPEGMDVVKLPAFVNFDRPTGWDLTGRQGMPGPELFRARAELSEVFLRHYAPQLFIVNHLPYGAENELEPALRQNRSGLRLLSLRGVLFDRDKTQQRYFSGEAARWLDAQFDHIFVHTDPDVFSLDMLYELPPELARKVVYTGYLTPETALDKAQARLKHGIVADARVVTASMGGGQGAMPIWSAIVDALRASPIRIDAAYLVTGPYLEREDQRELRALVADCPWISVITYAPDMSGLMAASDLFIGAAGANMLSEILSTRANSIAIPRQVREPEQRVHSGLLAQKGLLRACALDNALAGALRQVVPAALQEPVVPRAVALGGTKAYVELTKKIGESAH